MALVLLDRVQQTGTANTTVSFTVTGSVAGYQSWSAVGNGNTTYYGASDASGNWEVGLATYSTTGPTVTRTAIFASSNAGAAVTFSGTVNVWVDYPANKAVYIDASGNVNVVGTVAQSRATGDNLGFLATVGDTSNSYFRVTNNTNSTDFVQSNGGAFINAGSSQPFWIITSGIERLRITSAGGISFGSSGTAYVTSGQVLKSNGNAAPTWASYTNPTQTVLTSGSGTYTTPSGAVFLRIRMVGGGGGGGYGGGNATGSTGGTTTFNSVNAIGGSGGTGTNSATGVLGGAGGTGGTGTAKFRSKGSPGTSGPISWNNNSLNTTSGYGGASVLGGGALAATNGTPLGVAAGANTGGGGGGGGGVFGSTNGSSGAGGGEYVELYISSPSATYSYAVGAGGAGGGSGGSVGGNGGSGVIIIEEYYIY